MARLVTRVARRLARPFVMCRDTWRAWNGALVAHWYAPTKNWGDAVNPYLIRQLSGRTVVHENHLLGEVPDGDVYTVIGSVLQLVKSRNLVVWGTGIVGAGRRVQVVPKRVCAVRGPRTRHELLRQGIECPPVFGDPALLMPLFYDPRPVPKRYRLGVIPHYADAADPRLERLSGDGEVLVIDIKSGLRSVVDAVCSCDYIASSSLHGLIVADAYGVPSTWIEVGGRVAGAGFKFRDYFESVGRDGCEPIRMDDGVGKDDLIGSVSSGRIEIDLEPLILACPFIAEQQAHALIERVKAKGLYREWHALPHPTGR